jgi:hypothetical protein
MSAATIIMLRSAAGMRTRIREGEPRQAEAERALRHKEILVT